MYKRIIKPILFEFTPEAAHHFTLSFLEIILVIPGGEWLLRRIFCTPGKNSVKEIAGIKFPNPVGLAAGFDKDGKHLRAMSALGFGFIEVGTVTPLPQPGNAMPRLFRLPDDDALINRMGFNNQGVDVAASRIRHFRSAHHHPVIIGGNIGRNKSTANEDAIHDYEICFKKLVDCVDFFVVNVSSPNTPGLRELQEKEPLKKILNRLQELNHESESDRRQGKPIFLKIAPDLTAAQLDDIIEIVLETKLAGVVATNTTLSRDELKTTPAETEAIGAGGLSGKPLAHQSTRIIRYLKSKSQNKFSIIGAGGIHSAKDALEKISAGADLIEIYTGMIYEGPALIKKILENCR